MRTFFRNVIAALGVMLLLTQTSAATSPPSPPIPSLADLLTLADANHDSQITLDEVRVLYPAFPQEAFDFLDQNHDGVLTTEDLPPPEKDPVQQLLKLLNDADANHNGEVTLEEVQAILPEFPPAAFDFLDRNDDGVLSTGDLPSPDENLVEQLLELLQNADANHDGQITLEEIRALVPGFPQEAFDRLDRNSDGVLTSADVPPPPDQDRLQQLLALLKQADANHDGQVTLDEIHVVQPAFPQEIFDFLDRNHDGVLSQDDLPQRPDHDPFEQFLRLLVEADANSDHQLTLDEILAVRPDFPEDLFNQLDRNHDGVLSIADVPPPDYDPIECLLHLLHDADANHDNQVTLEEIRAILPDFPQDAFDRLDHNGDGVLSPEDLPVAGHDAADLLRRLLREADSDHNHIVTLEEIRVVLADFPQEAFDKLDRNGDGVLTVADLPPTSPYDPIARLLCLLRAADADANDEVTLDEIHVLLPDFPEDAFNRLDFNGDGVLSIADLPSPPVDDPLAHLLDLLRRADANDDGQVTIEELRAIMPGFPQDAFDKLDRNDDGVISRDDLPSGPPRSFCELLLDWLRDADTNRDGELTFAELQAVVPDLTQERFNELDSNGDGALSKDDLPPFPEDPTRLFLRLLEQADADENGEVTFDELSAVMPTITQAQFDKLDRNHDGVLTEDDAPALPVDPIDRLIRLLHAADADEDGEVTFAELQAVAPDLTQEQFDKLDRNHDGVITREDLPDPPQHPLERFLELLRQADADHNQEVTFAELQTVLPDLTQEQFDTLDRNHDSVISMADAPDGVLPPGDDARKALLRALVVADTNRDGQLDFAEIGVAFPDAPADLLDAIDTNDDWVITREELAAALASAEDGHPLLALHDLDGDGATNALDVQNCINQALGTFSNLLWADLNDNGDVDATDIQTVINGALGL